MKGTNFHSFKFGRNGLVGSYCQEHDQDWYRDQTECTVPRRNVHAGPRQRQGPGSGPIVSYFASPVSCTGAGPFPVQYCKNYGVVSLC